MNDAHARFRVWLSGGAEGEPPRDLAVHASVCATCGQAIGALDLLTTVDPGRAPMPSPQPIRRRGWAQAGGLTAATAAVVVSSIILGIGAWQLMAISRDNTAAPIGLASPTPDQGVLEGNQTPLPTPSAEGSPDESQIAGPSEGATAGPGSGGATPSPTRRPGGAGSTPRPSPLPTANPTASPSSQPSATASPTPTPTLMPTPSPTPTPTPAETATPTPIPSASESESAAP